MDTRFYTFFSVISMFIASAALYAKTTITTRAVNETTLAIELTVPLETNEYMYKDYLDFSVDHPEVTLSTWQCSSSPITHYDATFKENKKIFKGPLTITLQATKKTPWQPTDATQLYFYYYASTNRTITQEILPLTKMIPSPVSISLETAVDSQQHDVFADSSTTSAIQDHDEDVRIKSCSRSYADRIAAWLEHAQGTWWLQFILAFVLGVLVSLTPCIYPMIPITVGILQAQGSKSLLSNFLISLIYVAGIATTFALLGMMAAFAGQMFGCIIANPFVVLVIIALLVYVALSMLGLYDLYIPQSLQSNKSSIKSGSLISIFIFGAISGSVASPCLSPGLVLLLSIVTTLGSKIVGFLLLFIFGIGLGLPLIIIGTFSGSLALLPHAGMWMVEIKKLTGLIMLAMCFYFLKPILPWSILLILLGVFALAVGLWLLYDGRKTTSWRTFKHVLAVASIASSLLIGFYAYKAMMLAPDSKGHDSLESSSWYFDYNQALEQARQQNKLLFIDIGAPSCSMCTAIDHTMLRNSAVLKALSAYIAVKIDGSETSDPVIGMLQKEYIVRGFPTFLIIHPHTAKLIARWGSELYTKSPEEFIQELQRVATSM